MLASELEKVARTLSAKERARLVEAFLESLQDTPAAEVATAWNREIEARLHAYERGELQSLRAESVFAQARLLGR
ncbi:addiction module antitoxin RelB [Acidiferrobacter sp. SPIII_3]|uniref:addiction module protein n=1 Tax=Acidiferrobacter sp. SPIII_3 TaxID=1281578 RepID=UPI000D73E855|nr:addiction module protein [Acidiferrobacter sp. SPIII_3]AWP25019.1 addiction module antitoxin RelB [Acidiferrobacter sp. SPIII_3]